MALNGPELSWPELSWPELSWKAGVPLAKAWLHFAQGAERQAHESKPGYAGTVAHLVAVARSTRDGKQILAALQAVGNAHLDELASRTLLQDALRDVLRQGGLVATGYRGKTAAVIDPAALAQDALFDWDGSKLRAGGAAYARVRVADPAAVAARAEADAAKAAAKAARDDAREMNETAKAKAKRAPAKSVPVAPASAVPAPVALVAVERQARPRGASETIRAAIERLLQDESDFAARTRRSAAQAIRDRIGADYQKGNGLSDPNLARHVRRLCGVKVARRG
ncbi:hypothetical protein BH10PSE12_BH10PSE12_36330 [soil metagenome]